MANLNDVEVASLNGRSVSLGEVLKILKADGRLDFLQDALTRIIIADAARDAGHSVSDAELQEAADAFRQQRGLQSAGATEQWMAQQAISLEDLEDSLERSLLHEKLKQQVAAGKEEQFFAEHRLDFDAATIFHIVVADEGLASEIESQINEEDEDFAALARQHSIDPSAPAGGYLGKVARRGLSPAVQAAVFGANAGDVVGPVKTDQGYHVIKVEEIEELELDEARKSAIRDHLFADYLAEATKSADIKWEIIKRI